MTHVTCTHSLSSPDVERHYVSKALNFSSGDFSPVHLGAGLLSLLGLLTRRFILTITADTALRHCAPFTCLCAVTIFRTPRPLRRATCPIFRTTAPSGKIATKNRTCTVIRLVQAIARLQGLCVHIIIMHFNTSDNENNHMYRALKTKQFAHITQHTCKYRSPV